MEIFYINQRKSTMRRENIESMLIKYSLNEKVRRFEALTADNFQGTISNSEIGCFRSHEKLINDISDQHRIIFEDDVIFNEKLAAILPAIETSLDNGYDMLFMATLHPYMNLTSTVEFLKIKDHLQSQSDAEFSIIDGKQFYRSGTIAYSVNSNSKKKILDEINISKKNGYSMPIDFLYFKLIQEGKINAGVIFPFPIACAVMPTEIHDRKNDGIQELYDEHINLFSKAFNENEMLSKLISWAISKDLKKENIIAALLCLKHFEEKRDINNYK